MSVLQIELPPKLVEVFSSPRGELRFRGAYGGRGSGKSFSFAKMAAVFGAVETLRILCVRELQNSIKESFHAEIKNAIASCEWLSSQYEVGVDYIRGANGTEFIFRGLRHNTSSIKSLAQIDICIVEEAEDVPESSWLDLEPTIRAPLSEIWIIWNRKKKGSPTSARFIDNPPPRSNIVQMNYCDNPWFPLELEEQRLHALEVMDPAVYRHVWEGAYLEMTESQVLKGKYVAQEFEPRGDWAGPYYGLDFGFSQDPTAAVKCWVNDGNLYIEHEAGGVGLELDDTAAYLIDRIPDIAKHKVRADGARPESISYLKRHGLPFVEPVKKGAGSVTEGVAHIKSYRKIIVHPRCANVLQECENYSYKKDKLSGEVLPDIIDADNHYMDAIRYALRPLMSGGAFDYSRLA